MINKLTKSGSHPYPYNFHFCYLDKKNMTTQQKNTKSTQNSQKFDSLKRLLGFKALC